MSSNGSLSEEDFRETPKSNPFSDSSNQALDFNDSSAQLIEELRKVSRKEAPPKIQVEPTIREHEPVPSTSFKKASTSKKSAAGLPLPQFHVTNRSSTAVEIPENDLGTTPSHNYQRVLLITVGLVGLAAFVFATISLVGGFGSRMLNTNLPEDIQQRSVVISGNNRLPPASVVDFAHQKQWGTYRPHVFFGLKAKHVESPMVGLIWYKQPGKEKTTPLKLQHSCFHPQTSKQKDVVFLWQAHDGHSFGVQKLQDGNLSFSTEWFNTPGDSCLANVAVDPLGKKDESEEENVYGFILYFAVPTNNSESEMKPVYKLDGNNLAVLDWKSSIFGQLSLGISVNNANSESDKDTLEPARFSYVFARQDPYVDMVGVASLVESSLEKTPDEMFELKDIGLDLEKPNFAAVHVLVKAKGAPTNIELRIKTNGEELPSDFSSELKTRRENFENVFDQGFPVHEKDPKRREAAMQAVSNLLGGVGFWHGYTPVRNESAPGGVVEYGPLDIVAAVPSRSWFPRAFLWDDGFHQLLVRRINPELATEITAAWLDTMDDIGWIPREQALDAEARALMPKDYNAESNVANPPMLIHLTGKFLDSAQMEEEWFAERIRKLYPRLKQLYNWLKTSQSGPEGMVGAMRWRGRNGTTDRELNAGTLPSGFDDYPRSSHPTDTEYHLDLRCWMAHSSKIMRRLAQFVQDEEWIPEIEQDMEIFNDLESLDRLHWSEDAQQYSDYGFHSFNVSMENETFPDGSTHLVRKVHSPPKMTLVDDVNGYANLFPLLLRLLDPESEKLGILLKNLNNTETFWTPFGLRSVSKKSRYYMSVNGEGSYPYWRGPIWINMNYFALEALFKYSKSSETYGQLCRELYVSLRENLVSNIVNVYKRTGFFWEHYNDMTGDGEGTRPFTGWTALYALIASEQYD
ncbi:mannosyl-oligosaccharide glucosidase [Ditylenchus destructor]|nr:mannosyl-oligosaccharide glucosidase [Ditylenchus destructor]